jgi:formylglycine-generating enzyme required for sulfatase activity
MRRRTLAGAPPVRNPDVVAVTGRGHPLQGGRAPAWAVAWGEDRYGPFAAFAVGPPGQVVEHRMRWIPPGTFAMGSPETERGRWEDEGPLHDVVLTRGYWLGETPVTQALWVAVMDDNPSRFRGDSSDDLDRPVEQVSWGDCQAFFRRLHTQVAGLAARLPTEAEWERACRGGTQGATWVGELSGTEEAPELDAIAWYRGNSGEQTHPVGRRAPNPYGLHDMLGNVYEWCAYEVESYTPHPYPPRTHPVPRDQGSIRVIRGGSWYSVARNVRAAYRDANGRGDRVDYLGFRLAGGQESLPR